MCHATEKWTEILPTILLGFRAALKENLGCTSAELVYGKTVRLPGELFIVTKAASDPVQFVERLRTNMQYLQPKPTHSWGKQTSFVHSELHKCTHVFVR
ncbi:gag-pol polyprotein [Trichonephila clavipes]|nr:gag-pol polyprotein [Trichonephila clavipes]